MRRPGRRAPGAAPPASFTVTKWAWLRRPLLVPTARELTALGAAVRAATVLRGEDPHAVATRWRTSAGTLLAPVPRDGARLSRIREARAAALALTRL